MCYTFTLFKNISLNKINPKYFKTCLLNSNKNHKFIDSGALMQYDLINLVLNAEVLVLCAAQSGKKKISRKKNGTRGEE